jgi:hypothetical protein
MTSRACNLDLAAGTLAKAALQATARALHTAQLALDAAPQGDASASRLEALVALRDRLIDAYGSVPERERQAILDCRATLTSDDIVNLLALCVRG